MKAKTLQNLLFSIRLVKRQDLDRLADILAISFYDFTEFSDLTQSFTQWFTTWFKPLIRWSIALDLRSRLLDLNPRYACFVATSSDRIDRSDQIIATLEISLRHVPHRSTNLSSYIFLLNWNSCEHPYLSNLAVDPPYRRQGAAQQLILAAEQMAGRWGFEQIYLHVLENNYPALQLYYNQGYQLYKVDTDFSSWLFQSPRRFLLRKLLKS